MNRFMIEFVVDLTEEQIAAIRHDFSTSDNVQSRTDAELVQAFFEMYGNSPDTLSECVNQFKHERGELHGKMH